MFETYTAELRGALEQRVQVRTSRRVRDLVVELAAEHVVLRGRVSSYYVKQLAQHGVREILPRTRVANEIAVDHDILAPAGAA